MHISVITIVFNDLEGLQRTAKSVLKQKSNDYEWIVCDGGSGEELCNYLESLSGIGHWVSEPDEGIYDAMNKGVRLSQGDYVVFLNAGDIFPDENTLNHVASKLKISSEMNGAVIDVLFGGAFFELPSGNLVYRGTHQLEDYMWHGLPANHQATYYRRNLLLRCNYDLTYKICGDYYIIARLYRMGISAAYLDEPLVRFQIGGTSYRNRWLLFSEPYAIQRDILNQSFIARLKSIFKRATSTIIMITLSQKWCPNFIFKLRSNAYTN